MIQALPALVAVGIALVCSSAEGAMAPRFERWAMLTEDSIASKLSDYGPVERIEVTPTRTYRVWAGKCFLDATIGR